MSHQSKVIWISNVDGSSFDTEEEVIGYDAANSGSTQAWITGYLEGTGRFKTPAGLKGAVKSHQEFISAYEIAKAAGELEHVGDEVADVLKVEEVEEIPELEEEAEEEMDDKADETIDAEPENIEPAKDVVKEVAESVDDDDSWMLDD